ncbi:MAG: glycoside hydrolase family 28 protein [Calditrichaeota bacterium]|nr:glycoside hydrolase family 28 protein [Calditrichota bacterium]
MSRVLRWVLVAGLVCLSGPAALAGEVLLDVTDFGAVGDGATLSTLAIQRAVDSCAARGGGTVVFPAGAYLTGTVVLRSHVTLQLEAGAKLLGSTNLRDYPLHVPAYRSYTDHYTVRSLLYAEKAENVAILGPGEIDGQGAAFSGPHKQRPYILRFVECRGVTVRDVTFRNSAMWVQHYLACDDVLITGVRVHSLVNKNNDGIDIDSCSRVRISDCAIRSGDDALVLKATSGRVCRDVVVTNCVLSTDCNALKLGTESNGGFQNIAVANCTIVNTKLAGLCLEEVDGGVLDGVSVHGLVMNGVGCPIFIRLGNRARPYTEGLPRPGVGQLRNVVIENVQATAVTDSVACSITGLPDHPVENVTLRDIRLEMPGGGSSKLVRLDVPEREAAYPEYRMFGMLPAYGFYVRHARNLRFDGVQLAHVRAEARPALVAQDVQGLVLNGFEAQAPEIGAPLLWLTDVRSVLVIGTQPAGKTPWFLRLDGNRSEGVSLLSNDFSNVTEVVRCGPDVRPGAVRLEANILGRAH